MYKGLYDCFEHWFNDNRGQVYFYSDTHFGDEHAHAFRDFSDDEQVRRINSKVGKYDTIVFLGDVGDVELMRKVKGRKILIMGNHDAGATIYKKRSATFTIPNTYSLTDAINIAKSRFGSDGQYKYDLLEDSYNITIYSGIFDEVYEGPLIISEKIILSHEPIMGLDNFLNIHGHCHSVTPEDKNHFNVCAEHINYTPIQLSSDVIKSGRLSKITTQHRDTINTATERKAKRLNKKGK